MVLLIRPSENMAVFVTGDGKQVGQTTVELGGAASCGEDGAGQRERLMPRGLADDRQDPSKGDTSSRARRSKCWMEATLEDTVGVNGRQRQEPGSE